jgi:hypothetical protein
MDEQSAYYIDGLTRLGLVLGDAAMLARTKASHLPCASHLGFLSVSA